MTRYRSWRGLVGALALVGGCNCGNKGTSLISDTGVPDAPNVLNFGNVGVGQTVRLPLLLANTGTGILDVDTQTVSGPPFSEPTLLSPASLTEGVRAQAVVAFSPTMAGSFAGTVVITDDGQPGSATVRLVGVGLTLDVTATPPSLSFGQVPVGILPAPTKTVSLVNTAAAAVYVTLSTAGTASEYTVTDSSGAPVPSTPVQLAPNTPYVVTVAFEPDSVSIFDSSFTYTPCEDATTATCLSPQIVSLTGQGVSGALALTPNPIVFNGVPMGTTPVQTVTATNTGSGSLTPSCIYLESLGAAACGTASSSFSLGAPSVALGAPLAAGASFTFPLTYLPGSNTATDTLAVTYTPQGLAAATATDPIEASPTSNPCTLSIVPTSLTFNYTTAGTPVSESVALTNTGGSTCDVTAIAIDPTSDPSYSLEAGQATSLTISPSGSASIGVTFDLAANSPPTTRLGHLDFQSNDPTHASVQIPLLATTQITNPYAGNGAWPRWHHDNLQSGQSTNDTSMLAGTIAWTVPVTPSPLSYWGTNMPTDYLNSPVVGSDGTVYQLGMNGTLYAVSASGSLNWQTSLESSGSLIDPHPSTPIILADGTLYVAFGESAQLMLTNALFHVGSDGSILSQTPPVALMPAAGSGDGFDLPPMLTNGGLLVGADDLAEGDRPAAFVFDMFMGSSMPALVLSAPLSGENDQISAVVASDDTTYWCMGGFCDALAPPTTSGSGFTELPGWYVRPTASNSATEDLALDEIFTGNLMILFGNWNYGVTAEPAQQLVALNPTTRANAWTVTLPAPTAAQLAADPNYIGEGDATVGNSCPAIGNDGTVYVGNFDGLHAINGATGVENSGWPFLTNDDDVLTAPAIGADGTIFFGTAGGKFYAVNPDGTPRFMVTAGGRIAGSPAIGPSGAVYFVANDGNLYAVN